MTDKAVIVIPSYNHWDLTERLLTGLHKFETDNIEMVIVMDDHSTDPDVSENVSKWFKKLPLLFIRNEKNSGFLLTANNGLKIVTDTYQDDKPVFLISNDVEVRGRFISAATEILSKKLNCLIGNRYLQNDTGWNTFDGVTFPYLEGFFLASSVIGWRNLNFFDVQYAPMDFEDVDLSTTALDKGYLIASLNTPAIFHQGGATYGYTDARRLQTERNREKFRLKWHRA